MTDPHAARIQMPRKTGSLHSIEPQEDGSMKLEVHAGTDVQFSKDGDTYLVSCDSRGAQDSTTFVTEDFDEAHQMLQFALDDPVAFREETR